MKEAGVNHPGFFFIIKRKIKGRDGNWGKTSTMRLCWFSHPPTHPPPARTANPKGTSAKRLVRQHQHPPHGGQGGGVYTFSARAMGSAPTSAARRPSERARSASEAVGVEQQPGRITAHRGGAQAERASAQRERSGRGRVCVWSGVLRSILGWYSAHPRGCKLPHLVRGRFSHMTP
jgi:hypothetical protein